MRVHRALLHTLHDDNRPRSAVLEQPRTAPEDPLAFIF